MSDGNHIDSRYTTVSYPRLDEKQLEGFRGLNNRGLLKDARPPETFASMYDEKRGQIRGCTEQSTLNDLVNTIDAMKTLPPNGDIPNRPTILFDRATLRRLIIVGGNVATFHNGTPCLFRLATLIDRCLSRHLYNNFRGEFFHLVEFLIGIGDEIIRRTQKPYRLFVMGETNPPLDSKVLRIEPLPNYHYWKTLLDVRSGQARIMNPRGSEMRFVMEDRDDWQQTLDEIERSLEARRVKAAIKAAKVGEAPEINGSLKNLQELKFADIERQSRARFPRLWRDDSVAGHLGLIIYHSVCSVLLDASGNPFKRKGIAPHSLLIPDPGDNLLRESHGPGLYVSLGPLADYQFWVSGKRVKNLLLSGIIRFTRMQNKFSFEHYLQQRLQEYIKNNNIHVIAAIVVPEAFRSPDVSFSAIRSAMPALIEATWQQATVELQKRLGNANWEQIIKDVGEQIIREIIESKVKGWCREWLIKKIGKKFVPGVNLLDIISDLRDQELTEMTRALIGCVILVANSKRPDDLTISSKIVADIALDKVQEAIVKELVNRGGKLLKKPAKPAGKVGGAKEEPPANKPQATTEDKPSAPAQAATPTSPAYSMSSTGKSQIKPMTQTQLIEAMRAAQQTQLEKAQEKPQSKTEAKPQQRTKRPDPSPDPGVSDKGTNKKAVDDKGTATDKPATPPVKEKGKKPETVELQPGVYRRRGSEKKPDPPPPPRKDDPEQKKRDRDKEIADTQRELTNRGVVNRGKEPNIRPSESNPDSIKAALDAGVPREVTDSGYVMTRVDVPTAVPDRPIPAGRRAPEPLPSGPVSRSAVQNTEVLADIALTMRSLPKGSRVVDVRVNQTQTATDGGRAGTNRPDLQLTIVQAELPNGTRVHIEYDRSPPTRALDHARRIIANDPDAIVILKIIDFEPPNRQKTSRGFKRGVQHARDE